MIENNIHDHAASIITTTVVNTCTRGQSKPKDHPKKGKCRKK